MSFSNVADEMHALVREAAEPVPPGDSVKAAINRAARSLGISTARARSYWYRLVKLVPAEEADALRKRRNEIRELRIQRLEHELAALVALRRGIHDHDGEPAGAFRRLGDEAGPALCRPGAMVLPDRREAA